MTTTMQELTDRTRYRLLGSWRAEAWHRLDMLAHDIDRLELSAPRLSCSQDRRAAVETLRTDLMDIGAELNTTGPDEVWQSLHAAEECVARLSRGDQLLDYVEQAAEHLSDPALAGNRSVAAGKAWEHVRAAREKPIDILEADASLASDVATILHRAHVIIDGKHHEANDCSARLKVATIGLFVLSGLIVLAAVFFPQLPFLIAAEKFQGVSTVQLALLVVLGGLVGGSWGAFPTFTSGKRDTYRVQYVRAAARLAMGVLSALIGVSLLGAGWMSGLTGDSAPALFAVSIAFGLAQEPVTRALESKLTAKGGEAGADEKS